MIPLGDALREALPTYDAPALLRAWAEVQSRMETATDSRVRALRRVRRFAYAAGIVIAAAAGWLGHRVVTVRGDDAERQRALVAALVDTHVRSLMANHLTDVQASDEHIVKPWFAGKVTFAPRVPELASQGFPLVGGRAEFVAGRAAAALVYGRRLHTINLFIWPESPSGNDPRGATLNGYSLAHWTDRGLSYWAVSDAAAPELQAFEQAYRNDP